jgi:sugar-specific transcriptional regulator TrmB
MNTFDKNIYTNTLEQAGLTHEQSLIYDILLKNGPLQARKIMLKTGIKRGFVYKNLDKLVDFGLVDKKDEPGKITIFSPKHPNALLDLTESKKKELDSATNAIRNIVGQMTSDFNMISGKPSVQFFEGLSGVKKVLEDCLFAKSEILTYADLESLEKYIKKENDWYVAEREKFGLKKRGLVLDTEFNRNFLKGYHENITNVRLLPLQSEPFKTIVEIYDDKVSYITFIENENEPVKIISVLITNPAIAEFYKKLFEFNWQNSRELQNTNKPQLSKQLQNPSTNL